MKPLNSLISFGPKFELISFETAHSLFPILIQFDSLSRLEPSDFFEMVWDAKLKVLMKSEMTLSIQNVEPAIWGPVFSECEEILESIKRSNVKLKEVSNIMTCIGREHDICEQLHQLHSAVELCSGRSPSSCIPSWISESVKLMEHYLSLCQQADSAKTVLSLRNELQLSGDFSIIEMVANKVDTSMQEQPLSSVDSGVVTAVSFLEKLTSRKHMLDSSHTFRDCLQTFCDCLGVVEWIRKETKGTHYFKLEIFLVSRYSNIFS